MNKTFDIFVSTDERKHKNIVSEVGFEPTPSFEDQNAHFIEAKSFSLESGALDRSAILTLLRQVTEIHKVIDFWFLGYGE